jgi:hypothetical protein
LLKKRGAEIKRTNKRPPQLYLNAVVAAEAVQLVQKLKHSSLHLTISSLVRVETLGTNRIQLINEDNRGGLFLG